MELASSLDRTGEEVSRQALKGQRVVVVGGTSGMGLGTARAAAEAGAEVVEAGRRPVAERGVRAEADRIEHAVVDITDEASVRTMFERIGQLDHLFVTATPPAASGALAVVAGAATIARAQAGKGVEEAKGRPGWIALALVAGAILPIQGAVNALLRADIGAPITVGAVSFVVATLRMALVLLFVVATGRVRRPTVGPLTGVPWWGWLGGLCGAAYVTTVFTAIPVIGAATVVGLTVAGQQVASVFFDRWGLMRMPTKPVGRARLLGVVVLLLGVVLIQAT